MRLTLTRHSWAGLKMGSTGWDCGMRRKAYTSHREPSRTIETDARGFMSKPTPGTV